MTHFSQACKDFDLAISLEKTTMMGQEVVAPLIITIDDYEQDVIHRFTYLGSTIIDNIPLDEEISKWIGKAAITLACLTSHFWENPKLSLKN